MSLALRLYAGILCHFLGDYVLQSRWMASEKTRSHVPALAHVLTYGLIFWVALHPSALALAIIVGTHFAIDRWRLARFVVWAASYLSPPRIRDTPNPHCDTWEVVWPWVRPWSECSRTGSPPEVPDHIAFWVMVIVDNALHLACNTLALSL